MYDATTVSANMNPIRKAVAININKLLTSGVTAKIHKPRPRSCKIETTLSIVEMYDTTTCTTDM